MKFLLVREIYNHEFYCEETIGFDDKDLLIKFIKTKIKAQNIKDVEIFKIDEEIITDKITKSQLLKKIEKED